MLNGELKDVTQGQVFKWSKAGLNSEFSFSSTGCLAKNPICPIIRQSLEKKMRWIDVFLKAWGQSEMQTAFSRVWTWVSDSISYNDDHYAKCISLKLVWIQFSFS